ncbi:CCD63 protein, partial [Aegotheles bennettii]|nr:CCD63 protein [Aegotheles bennettii]
KEIESLVQEHEDLSLMLSQIMSEVLDDRICMKVQSFLQTKDQYDSLLRDRKALLDDLDNQMLELKNKIGRQHQVVVKVKQANNSKRLQEQAETLEMHLNNVTVHFDNALTSNSNLRAEVGSLQIQKAVFDNSYSKLQEKLDQQKRRMSTAVTQSTRAYEQRMEALARISALNEKYSKDTIQYNVELQEQARALDRETKLKIFMFTKFSDLSELEEQAKKKKALKAAQRVRRNKGESLESREVAYRRLLELTEDGDIDQLVNGFIEKDEKNFACYIYVTELNSEMEKLQLRIQDLQDEITVLMMDQDTAKSSNLHALQELEENLRKTTQEGNWYEERGNESNEVLGQLRSDMETLLKEVDCDTTKILNQLGGNGQITDVKLLQFFGLVEKKTTELLLVESMALYESSSPEGPDAAEPSDSPLLGSTALLRALDRAQLCPAPPAMNGTAGAIEGLEEPLGHEELRQLVLQSHQELGSSASAGTQGRNGVEG